MVLSPTQLGSCTPPSEYPHTWSLHAHGHLTVHLHPHPNLSHAPRSFNSPDSQSDPHPWGLGGPPSPACSHDPDLSELGSSLLLLHATVGHEVVKHFSCRAEAEWVRRGMGGGTESRAGRGEASPALAYSITRYSVFSVSITSKSFTAMARGWW